MMAAMKAKSMAANDKNRVPSPSISLRCNDFSNSFCAELEVITESVEIIDDAKVKSAMHLIE